MKFVANMMLSSAALISTTQGMKRPGGVRRRLPVSNVVPNLDGGVSNHPETGEVPEQVPFDASRFYDPNRRQRLAIARAEIARAKAKVTEEKELEGPDYFKLSSVDVIGWGTTVASGEKYDPKTKPNAAVFILCRQLHISWPVKERKHIVGEIYADGWTINMSSPSNLTGLATPPEFKEGSDANGFFVDITMYVNEFVAKEEVIREVGKSYRLWFQDESHQDKFMDKWRNEWSGYSEHNFVVQPVMWNNHKRMLEATEQQTGRDWRAAAVKAEAGAAADQEKDEADQEKDEVQRRLELAEEAAQNRRDFEERERQRRARLRADNPLSDEAKQELEEEPTIFTKAQITAIFHGKYKETTVEKIEYGVHIRQAKYLAVSKETIEEIFKKRMIEMHNGVANKKFHYSNDTYTCGDFASSFHTAVAEERHDMGGTRFAIGEVWSKDHCFNAIITKDGNILLFEPQTGKFLTENDIKQYEKCEIFKGFTADNKNIWELYEPTGTKIPSIEAVRAEVQKDEHLGEDWVLLPDETQTPYYFRTMDTYGVKFAKF